MEGRWQQLVRACGAITCASTVLLVSTGVGFAQPHQLRLREGAQGKVGPLHIDISTTADVIRVMGSPDAIGSGNFYAIPHTPNFGALGYSCGTQSSSQNSPVPGSGLSCHMVFYINEQTTKLAGVSSYSPQVVGPGRIYSGEPAEQAERRVHKRATSGCVDGFWLGSPHTQAELFVWVDGGHSSRNSNVIRGGRIGSIELESNRHPIGLLFC
jgi:hypothetical protein